MTELIDSLSHILDAFDVAVLDQWGVLHDGTAPYPGAVDAIAMLSDAGKRIVVLSNSGKRADLNRERIERIGIPTEPIAHVLTSGEALWADLAAGRLTIDERRPERLFAICARPDDALAWADGLASVRIAFESPGEADAVVVMGVADGIAADAHDDDLRAALAADRPLICSNPDLTSPRAAGRVVSPGVLARRYEAMGGRVIWYGKPHETVFAQVRALAPSVPPACFLMVGDSIEHDVAGAHAAGFIAAFVRCGIHADAFASDDDRIAATITELAHNHDTMAPAYSLAHLA